jgi:hypothetical protein
LALVKVGNLIVLPMLLFGLSRWIASGVGQCQPDVPVLNVCSGGLVSCRGFDGFVCLSRPDGAAACLSNPIHNLFFNAVPVKMRGRARAFVGGLY